MKPVDLTEFTNSPGWHIIHNPQTFMYEIKATNGVTKPGCWTSFRLAEQELYDYLSKASKHATKASKANQKKSEARAKAKKEVEDNSNLASEKISARTLQLAIN